jgi:hypothetical protein
MRAGNWINRRGVLVAIYFLATIQFAWCYLRLTLHYVRLETYEYGNERMPFQGRMLMMVPMRWASQSSLVSWLASSSKLTPFWFQKPLTPEALVEAVIDVGCLLLAGWATVKIYKASSSRQLLTPFIYPLFLVVCVATYIMHVVQNFSFLYDLPSLAFFSVAMYLMYFQKHWAWFAALFCVATVNRETTLLLLPLYMLNEAMQNGRLVWSRVLRWRTLAVVMPLGVLWAAWQIYVQRLFIYNPSEFYPRFDWNVKSLLLPLAWPQLLSAGGYLLLFVAAMHHRVADPRLRAWLWLLPVWLLFMFSYGILIETRIYGELIPLIVCATAIICEEMLLVRMGVLLRRPVLAEVDRAAEMRKAA